MSVIKTRAAGFDGNGFNLITASSATLTAMRSSALLDPNMSPQHGARYLVTDGALANKVVEWNTDAFIPIDKIVVNRGSATGAGVATRTSDNSTDTTTTTIETATIPGFLMSKNSKLRIVPFWRFDSAGTKNISLSLFSTAAGDVSLAVSQVSAANLAARHLYEIHAGNTYVNQFAFNNLSYSTSGGDYLNLAVDVKENFEIRFKCSWTANLVGNTIRLLGYTIELLA